MTEREYQPYDFRTVGTSDQSVSVLKNWLLRTSGTFLESWESISETVVQLECQRVRARTFDEAIASITVECIGCKLHIGEDHIPTLAYISSKDVVSLIGCIVGVGPVEDFENRELTSIEVSLCEMIFETLASALTEAWPGYHQIPITVDSMDSAPQRSRLLPPSNLVLETHLRFTVTEESADLVWLLPRKQMEPVLEAISGSSPSKTVNDPRSIVQNIELDVVGILGGSTLTMRELSELAVGDLVVLNQKIDQPLTLNIDNQPHYQCWPGRLANRQAVEITKTI